MATTYVEMTQGTPTSQRKFTYSGWIKKCEDSPSAHQHIFSAGATSDSYYNGFRFLTGDALHINMDSTGSATWSLTTNRLFRDPTAWYHIVVAIDTTQAVAADRMKLYINGVQETSFSQTDYPTLNWDFGFMVSGDKIALGRQISGSSEYFNGDMSHIVFVDGLQLAASYFGETDSTSGIWKYKQPVVSSYGTNGFYLKMENSSNMDLDSSGNAQTFTTTGTLIATKDNPDNNFTTMNSIDNQSANATYSNGNTTVTCAAGGYYAPTRSILGMSSGKWYFEVEAGHTDSLIGIISTSRYSDSSAELGHYAHDYGLYGSDGKYRTADAQVAYSGDTYTTGDIICVAVDLDNNKLYFRKDDGSWMNSGDPTSGATGTGAISITAPSSTETGNYFAAISGYTTASPVYDVNFGNGYFGTTAVSSTNADDAGIGSFEFDVPTGYYTLCTKNIKAYGG